MWMQMMHKVIQIVVVMRFDIVEDLTWHEVVYKTTYKNEKKYQHINGLGTMEGIFAEICEAVDKL